MRTPPTAWRGFERVIWKLGHTSLFHRFDGEKGAPMRSVGQKDRRMHPCRHFLPIPRQALGCIPIQWPCDQAVAIFPFCGSERLDRSLQCVASSKPTSTSSKNF
jgi:hypothetical protein